MERGITLRPIREAKTQLPTLFIDIETDNTEGNGLNVFKSRVVTLQILVNGRTIIMKDPESLEEVRDLLENCLCVGHNIGFDSRFLKYHYGITLYNVFDTQIAEIIISGGRFAGMRGVTRLQDVVLRRCGVEMSKHEQKGFVWGQPLTEAQKKYVTEDLAYLPEIYRQQQAEIKRLHLEEVIDIEMKAIPAMVWLYLSGISFDANRLAELRVQVLKRKTLAQAILYKAFNTSKINFGSPLQLKKALASIGIIVEDASVDSIKNARVQASKGTLKIGKKARQSTLFGGLEEEVDPIDVLDAITDYKEADKLLNTFIDKLPTFLNPKTGRVHSEYRQLGAKSGRMSCTSPNMQQQPSKRLPEWRTIFSAPAGKKIVVADYSQAELRILTELSRDEHFTKAYHDGTDMHQLTASKIFHVPIEEVSKRDRSIAKTINFGIVYGLGASSLQRRLKTDSQIEISEEEAKSIISGYHSAYPGISRYLKEISVRGLRDLEVRTKAGRLMSFEEPKDESEESMIGRLSCNLPIQGLCADITKLAIGELFLKLEPRGVKFLAVVHDEIVLECDEGDAEEVAAILEDTMNSAGKRYIKTIPWYAEAEVADYWKH